MSVAAPLAPEVLEAVAATCLRCWKETNLPPPASAIYLMDDYEWAVICRRSLQDSAVRLARERGYQGTVNDLQHAAHREMYARSGDAADLARMLRHVIPDA